MVARTIVLACLLASGLSLATMLYADESARSVRGQVDLGGLTPSGDSFGVPYLVHDTPPASYRWSQQVRGFATVNGVLLYLANPSLEGYELWRTDGTPEGTRQVSTAGTGFDFLFAPRGSTGFRYALLWDRFGADGRPSLWWTDGSPGNVREIATDLVLDPTVHFLEGSQLAVFTASPWTMDGSRDWELWVSDGTEAGTHRLIDLRAGEASIRSQLVRSGDTVVFLAWDDEEPGGGTALWSSDGTAAGTVLLARPSAGSFRYLWSIQGSLLLESRVNATDITLWRSDGTPEGTLPIRNFGTESSGSFTFIWPTTRAPNGSVLFNVNTREIPPSLWATDETAAGTVKLLDLDPAATFPYVFPTTLESWSYFLAYTGGQRTLWRTDGTFEGTAPAPDFCPGDCGEQLLGIRRIADLNLLWLTLEDGNHGIEPWISDGTRSGTWLLADICPGPCDSWAEVPPVRRLGRWLFLAQDPSAGTAADQIWQTDLSTHRTTRVTDFAYGVTWFPSVSVALQDKLLFLARDEHYSHDIWALPLVASEQPVPLSPAGLVALGVVLALTGAAVLHFRG